MKHRADDMAALDQPRHHERRRTLFESRLVTRTQSRLRAAPKTAWDVLVLISIVATAAAVYLPYALHAGWYYDDWSVYSLFQDTGGGVTDDLRACATQIPGGRDLACLYHGLEYDLLTNHRSAYHIVAIGFLVLISSLGYAILRRCHLSRAWSGVAGILLIVFPASDATRLWPVAAIGQYVVALVFAAVLLALIALGREKGPLTIGLHGMSVALAVLAMATYEIALPLVALSGSVYIAAYRNRRAVRRGLLDLALIFGFLAWRLVVSPPAEDSGFVVRRTADQTITRVGSLLTASWDTWKFLYAPTTSGTVALVVIILGATFVGRRDTRARHRLLRWAVVLAVSTVFAVASSLVFLTANDLYLPAIGSTYNRLNLPGSFPYVMIFVALLGLAYELSSAVGVDRRLGGIVIALVTLAIAWHQLGVSSVHKRAWERSWHLQEVALAGYAAALRGVPATANIVGFDTPIWERDFVPVFAATWDLRGAIDYTTEVDPPYAIPWASGARCGNEGVTSSGSVVVKYQVAAQPLFFVSPKRKEAVRVTSRVACERVLKLWGPPAFWAADAFTD